MKKMLYSQPMKMLLYHYKLKKHMVGFVENGIVTRVSDQFDLAGSLQDFKFEDISLQEMETDVPLSEFGICKREKEDLS